MHVDRRRIREPQTPPTGATVALYAGSFDPVTHGHLDLIRRAARLFNALIIGVGTNPEKSGLFSQRERLKLLAPHIDVMPNVRAEAYDGLTVDFARRCGAQVLIRGIRNMTDLGSELQQANVNMSIGDVDTVFLLTTDQYVMTSSTYIRQIYEMGGGDRERVLRLVPENVADALSRKLRPRRKRSAAVDGRRGPE